MTINFVSESESWEYVFVFHGSRMAAGETSSFGVKEKERQKGKK